MTTRSIEQITSADPNHAIEIADRVWWVGHNLEGDKFQCHTYLIEHGDQSVLFDPGSKLTFRHTLRKIDEVIPFSNIRYFVCHHQDPDITGSLPLIEELVSRDDAVIVSHWRAEALLKHYDPKIPFWLVEDHDWLLDLGGRVLKFVFTPYLHFPGAFCTFDREAEILFSSDIFEGFTDTWSLVASDESYFESIRTFHEHYMPSRDILQHGLSRFDELDLEMIAPQHGSIIPKHLIPFMIEKLKGLDCGLYLMARENTDIERLTRLNRLLGEVMESMILYRDFKQIAAALLNLIRGVLPAESLDFYTALEDDENVLHLAAFTRFRGARVTPPQFCRDLLGLDRGSVRSRFAGDFVQIKPNGSDRQDPAGGPALLVVPLYEPDRQLVESLAVVHLKDEIELTAETEALLRKISLPLGVAIERERIYRMMEMERSRIYERSIRDSLTGLYTRVHMEETLKRLMDLHDRDPDMQIALAMLDIDHFKKVNDTHGHLVGDEVLRRVAGVLQKEVRRSDLAVRFGGEEFAIFLAGKSAANAPVLAERVRKAVGDLQFPGPMEGSTVTVSIGVAQRRMTESLESFIGRADAVLYKAKRSGRNRVCEADSPNSHPS